MRPAAGNGVSARIAIPDVAGEMRRWYAGVRALDEALMLSRFKHFGLVVDFTSEGYVALFDGEFRLADAVKRLIEEFGVCIFRNIRLSLAPEQQMQRNIFPDLVFHVDRGSYFENQFSLFYRDPTDPAHRMPRNTSTLIMPNAAIRLQAEREGVWEPAALTNCHLFQKEPLRPAVGHVVLEQPWDAPPGSGEVVVFDNRTVLHASHHRGARGYPIAVQYLY